MATKLIKSITRESMDTIDDKGILVTLTEGQEIELKLKGKRGRGELIRIKDLYNKLNGVDTVSTEGSISIKTDSPKKHGDEKMISLYDLRSQNAISMLDLSTMSKFDQIIKSVIDSY